jgi:hypothetical protein
MSVLGEILETNSLGFRAQSEDLHQPPALGSLVRAPLPGHDHIYGIVSLGQTTGLEPGRRPLKRSTSAVTDEEVYREHPQLAHTLHTQFDVVLAGWQEGPIVRHTLPPQPPPLHYTVRSCQQAEVLRFTARLGYFRMMLNIPVAIPAEQLLAAHIRWVYHQQGQDADWLQVAAQEVAHLLKSDYERLMTVLSGIEPVEG